MQSLEEVEIPDGTWKARMSGYIVEFKNGYSFETDEGLRGKNIPVKVTVEDGIAYVEPVQTGGGRRESRGGIESADELVLPDGKCPGRMTGCVVTLVTGPQFETTEGVRAQNVPVMVEIKNGVAYVEIVDR